MSSRSACRAVRCEALSLSLLSLTSRTSIHISGSALSNGKENTTAILVNPFCRGEIASNCVCFSHSSAIGMQRAEKEKRDLEKRWWIHSQPRRSIPTLQTYHYVKSRLHFVSRIICARRTSGKNNLTFDLFPRIVLLYRGWLCWWEGGGEIIGKRPALTCGRFSLWVSLGIVPWWISETSEIVDSSYASRGLRLYIIKASQQMTTANKTVINYFPFPLLSGTYTLHKAK